jgi:xanthine phosphoribosyltransferase
MQSQQSEIQNLKSKIMNTKSFAELMRRFSEIEFKEKFDMVVAIANGGIIPAAIINQRLNAEFNIIKINYRDAFQQPKYDEPQLLEKISFDCKNRTVLLVEDRVKSGASLQTALKLLHNAKMIKTFAVNGNADYCLFNEECFKFAWNL